MRVALDKSDILHRFTTELYKRGVIRERDHHEYWGRYYDIPECCIANFIYLTEEVTSYPASYMWTKYENYPRGVGYVSCPKCIARSS